MSKYRDNLPQLSNDLYLTDGGLETTMIFHNGFELPNFAAFVLLDDEKGMEALREYYRSYIEVAKENGTGFILESPTWRASQGWGSMMEYSPEDLVDVNRRAMHLLKELRGQYEDDSSKMPISLCIGSRGDGYDPKVRMTVEEAERYHATQINTVKDTEADMISAFTMAYSDEAIGMVLAAQKAGMPIVIAFTVETDGRLPSGETLKDAIERVDAETGNGPVYYMVNCAHPTHFRHVLHVDEPWMGRIKGIRANASTLSHAELDEAEELDDGDPQDLTEQYAKLREVLPNLTIFGGCCGTDTRHIRQFCTLECRNIMNGKTTEMDSRNA